MANSEQVFKGKVFSVDRDRVTLPNGREVTLDIVRHPKSVVLVPVPEPGHVILVRQYRHAVNANLWELPAGSLDPGETPEQAAARECHAMYLPVMKPLSLTQNSLSGNHSRPLVPN